ncbi:uncharacterized protein LOC117123948 [Anneissia japonica]|uniref:uncharacterized protein LOC117123948 n=1 Tax=Anneissia japonica TaxID=1529436 RepID=UPI001425A0E8|nr:uncharacterized protein LOC117123948 [Anneissia japonica]
MGVDCGRFCLCLRRIPYLSLLAGVIFVAASILLGIKIQNAADVYQKKFNISDTRLTEDESKIIDYIEKGTLYLIIVTAVFVAIGIVVAFLETGPTRLKYCIGKWKKCCGLFWTDVLIGATFLMFLIWLVVAATATFAAAAVLMLKLYCDDNKNIINIDLNVYGPVMGFAQDTDPTDGTRLCKSAIDLWNDNLMCGLCSTYAIVIAHVLFLASHVANHSYLKLMTPTETLEGLDGTAMSKM